MSIKVNCDFCHEDFKLKDKMLKKKKVTDEVVKICYKCPNCRHEYIVGYLDKEITENIEKIKELQLSFGNGEISLEDLNIKVKNLKDRNMELNYRYKSLFKG